MRLSGGTPMSRINSAKVVLAGLLAGLVINISETILNTIVAGQAMEEALRARNLPPVGGAQIAGFVFFAFLIGIFTVWLYAAIRPRFGAGPKTAVIAGLAVWFSAYFYPSIVDMLMGLFPMKITALGLGWGLVEIILASLAGGWAYTE
jgi:apolipoprotein N-acyltransferase